MMNESREFEVELELKARVTNAGHRRHYVYGAGWRHYWLVQSRKARWKEAWGVRPRADCAWRLSLCSTMPRAATSGS